MLAHLPPTMTDKSNSIHYSIACRIACLYVRQLENVSKELANGKTLENALHWYPAAKQTLEEYLTDLETIKRVYSTDRRIKLNGLTLHAYAKPIIKDELTKRPELAQILRSIRAAK